jgi:uncharacterized membrane protein
MAHIEGSVRIKAPVEEAFRYVSDWQHVGDFYEGIQKYRPVGEVECGDGAKFECSRRVPVLGELDYVMEMSDFVENHGWTFRSVEGISLEEHWWFEDLPGWPRETKLNYDLKYKVPVPVVGGLVDRIFVKRKWEECLGHCLRNIKVRLEQREGNRPAIAEATG